MHAKLDCDNTAFGGQDWWAVVLTRPNEPPRCVLLTEQSYIAQSEAIHHARNGRTASVVKARLTASGSWTVDFLLEYRR